MKIILLFLIFSKTNAVDPFYEITSILQFDSHADDFNRRILNASYNNNCVTIIEKIIETKIVSLKALPGMCKNIGEIKLNLSFKTKPLEEKIKIIYNDLINSYISIIFSILLNKDLACDLGIINSVSLWNGYRFLEDKQLSACDNKRSYDSEYIEDKYEHEANLLDYLKCVLKDKLN